MSYVRDDVMPVVAGRIPSAIARGFDEFLKADRIADASQRNQLNAAESEGQTDLFDTHPSLRDRLAALGPAGDVGGAAHTGGPASGPDWPMPTRRPGSLWSSLSDATPSGNMKPIDWNLVGESVHAWRGASRENLFEVAEPLNRGCASSDKPRMDPVGSGLVRKRRAECNSDVRSLGAVYLCAVVSALCCSTRLACSHEAGSACAVFVRGSETVPSPLVRSRPCGRRDDARSLEGAMPPVGVVGRPLADLRL